MSAIQAPEQVLCKYMRTVEELKSHPNFDADDAYLLQTWLDGEMPAEHVRTQLGAAGFFVSSTTIKDHRRSVCACRVDI